MSISNFSFDTLKKLDLQKLHSEVSRFQDISAQLDYLKKTKERYYDPIKEMLQPVSGIEKEELYQKYIDTVYGELVVTTLKIPVSTYDYFFKGKETTPEFTYWFVSYNGQLQLEDIKSERKIEEKLASPLRDQILVGELSRIKNIEEKATTLLTTGVIDPFSDQEDSYMWEVEYLRFQAAYYNTNALPSIEPDLLAVQVYATHVYFKNFLLVEQQQFKGDITDQIALEAMAKEEPPTDDAVLSNSDLLGPYDDHGLGFFKETREYGIPIFKPEIIDSLFSVVKHYFSEKDQLFLETLFLTGKGGPDKLLFLSQGNQLADVFHQLVQNNLIFNCIKSQLEDWVVQNFQYMDKTNPKDFTSKYLNKIISTPHRSCKNPIIEILKDTSTEEKLLKPY